jgi:hypothetical protein
VEAKFFSGLFEGDSPNGLKLGMSLTGGDFWVRVGGCQNLYRGEGYVDVDLGRIIASVDIGDDTVSVSAWFEHEVPGVYTYMLRRVNVCGDEEQSGRAVVRVRFDEAGELIADADGDVLVLPADWYCGGSIGLDEIEGVYQIDVEVV